MTWLAVILLAAVAFAIAAIALRLPRSAWTAFAAALVFGLAGYAWQARPGVPSAPKSAQADVGQAGWEMVEARKEMVALPDRSRDSMTLFADGQARKGRYADSAIIYEGVVENNPKDVDAWLALGNALVEHAEGRLTPAALHAYRQAERADEGAAGPGYFLGIALIRQGELLEARKMWADTLASASPDAEGREALAIRLQRLDELLVQAGAPPLDDTP